MTTKTRVLLIRIEITITKGKIFKTACARLLETKSTLTSRNRNEKALSRRHISASFDFDISYRHNEQESRGMMSGDEHIPANVQYSPNS